MLASILFALMPLVSAIVTPTTPDGSTVINEGSSIDAVWTADTTGEWTNMTIQLMTGDNLSMIPLRTLISGVDGTTTTTFSTPAPDVEPNSKIYFLQFTNGNDPAATWTTRFTIAAADGTTTEPEQTTNYSGEDVQWGVGAIVGESTGSNSTTPSSGTGAGAGMVSSASMSASASASTSTGSGITNYGPSSSGSAIANPSNVSGPSRASSVSEEASATVSQAASSASTSPNAAAAFAPHVAVGGMVGVVGIVMGFAL